MNGFSVCNKLKKDVGLKDVPLIIMSSESSEETFDQHRKLRTRAEDYVRKPIAFGELLQHIRQFLPDIGGPAADAEGAIVVEDEIDLGSAEYLDDSTVDEVTEDDDELPADEGSGRQLDKVDADVDAFAESAFGRLTGAELAAAEPVVEAHSVQNGSPPAELAAIPMVRSQRPPPQDPADQERIRAEVAALREQLANAQHELDEARHELGKLRLEVNDSARLAREIDELRAKLLAASKTGGAASRDFLDLREALNKKDKELISQREQLSRKDREIVEAHDRALGLERGRADLEDRLLVVERELTEAKEKQESAVAELEVATKVAEDVRARLERTRVETDSRERQLTELRAKQADERAATDAKLAAVRAEADQILANERAEHAQDRQDSLNAQATQLRQEHEGALAALRRTQQQELDRAKSEASQHEQSLVSALRAQHGAELKAMEEERDRKLAAAEATASGALNDAHTRIADAEMELSAVRGELQSLAVARNAAEEAHQARLADAERRLVDTQNSLEMQLTAALERIGTLENQLETARRELMDASDRLAAERLRADRVRAKAEADRQSLERAKDALAIALSQIEETEAPIA
jgi:chromosome segregation ATPase